MPLNTLPSYQTELLAPAKNLIFGKEAILHGADAVYIGAPQFGARAAAGNTLADIQALVEFAHTFHARVYVTLNTILLDEELQKAIDLIKQCDDIGVDAIIIQDMGLLEQPLPPIELHASTQCDIRGADKAAFLESAGFSQLVLARELSLNEIRDIAQATTARLEYFIHGALCVSYSGQCYLSFATTGRSANRGECAQNCRLPYQLLDSNFHPIAHDQHFLSIKDNNQSHNLKDLLIAGVRSFKIEGRLKDIDYLKNVTAHYRLAIDQAMQAISAQIPNLTKSSNGGSTYSFTPDLNKTFNRGYTDYFTQSRPPDLGAFLSPKFQGELIGHITKKYERSFEINLLDKSMPLHNGDGLSFYDQKLRSLQGIRVNQCEKTVQGFKVFIAAQSNRLPSIGDKIYRNHDIEFHKQLSRSSANRAIHVDLQLNVTQTDKQVRLPTETSSLTLTLQAYTDCGAMHQESIEYNAPASDHTIANLAENWKKQISKTGNTIFAARRVEINSQHAYAIPAKILNHLRRSTLEQLETTLRSNHIRYRREPVSAAPLIPKSEHTKSIKFQANVINKAAKQFYEKHGITVLENGYELAMIQDRVTLMTTKHCVRYSLNICPKQTKGTHPDPLYLQHNNDVFELRFHCKPCIMEVIGNKKDTVFAISPKVLD